MLNGYCKEIPYQQARAIKRMTPSSRQFSKLTPFYTVIIANCVGWLTGTGISIAATGSFNPVIAPIVLLILIAMCIRMAKSYKIMGFIYNEHLVETEKAFNKMHKPDRKKYAKFLEDAYRICALDSGRDRSEVEKIRKLFELSAPKPKDSELDLELQVKMKLQEDEQELVNIRNTVLAEFDKDKK